MSSNPGKAVRADDKQKKGGKKPVHSSRKSVKQLLLVACGRLALSLFGRSQVSGPRDWRQNQPDFYFEKTPKTFKTSADSVKKFGLFSHHWKREGVTRLEAALAEGGMPHGACARNRMG